MGKNCIRETVPFWTSRTHMVLKNMFKTQKTVTPLLILLLIFSAFSGCGGEEIEEYSGPIDIVLIMSANSGTLEITKGNDNATIDQQSNPVSIEFDLSNTTSGSGDITGFTINPGDGSDMIYSNGSENGVFTHEYSVHGVFEAIITAMDSEDNERSISEEIRIDYHQEHDNQNTANPDVVWVDYIGPSTDIPMWINVTSEVENTPGGPLGPLFGNDDPVTVTWTLYDGQDNIVGNATTETIDDGDSATFEYQAEMPITIDWRLEITLDEDVNVNTATVFDISYNHAGM
ncbi:MAG TPA: PKD domain-containing protein [Candidatus Poseidoniaceae archaeon]|nr:PKD domain-containing protein [Candidatus Poseidoniaceae archaeon]